MCADAAQANHHNTATAESPYGFVQRSSLEGIEDRSVMSSARMLSSFARTTSRQPGRPSEDKMEEKFIVVWTIDGETMSIPHSTQDEALHQAEKLLRKSMGAVWRSLYIWMMRYLRRLPSGSIKSGCGNGVLPGFQPSESKCARSRRSWLAVQSRHDVLCGGDRRCGEREGKGELFEHDHGGGGSLRPAISIASLVHRVASR